MRTATIRIICSILILILGVVIGMRINAGYISDIDTEQSDDENIICAEFSSSCTDLIDEEVEEWVCPLTDEEIDLIALVTMGEAEGESDYGKRLVIDTILNRVDNEHFPDTVYDVVYQKNQFSVMWNDRLTRCWVMPEIVELVKEELFERTNHDVIFFTSEGYSKYGKPMFKECCHYFSSYD